MCRITAEVLFRCNYCLFFFYAEPDFDLVLHFTSFLALLVLETMSGKGIGVPIVKDSSTTIEGSHHVYCTSESNRDSRNLDFALRNGLAGGVAGCAVSLITLATNGRLLM